MANLLQREDLNSADFSNDFSLANGGVRIKTGAGSSVAAAIAAAAPTGSETKVTGAGIASVSGAGTAADPYIVNVPAPTGAETKIVGAGVASISGTGVAGDPYTINVPAPTGAETVVTAGSNITVTGTGVAGDPYVVSAVGGPTGLLTVTHDATMTGDGTAGSPLSVVIATETAKGIVELASTTEAAAGTSTILAVTPAGLAAFVAANVTGSETKVTAGTNVTVTGTGTTADPYVVAAATPTGDETKVTAGANVTVTGTGTAANPYVVAAATPSGSETKVIAGSFTTVTGTGTTADPYVVNALCACDGSETKLTVDSSTGLTLSGSGTTANPYVITKPVTLAIATPTILSPANNSTTSTNVFTVTSSAFLMTSGVDTHASSDWQIATDSSFTNVVDSYSGSANLTTWTPNALAGATDYYIRVKHNGTQGESSSYSTPVKVTTGPALGTQYNVRAVLSESDSFDDIIYGPNGFVAYSDFYTNWNGSDNLSVYHSVDGITWTRQAVTNMPRYGAMVSTGSEYVYLGLEGSTVEVWTSTDGISWSQRATVGGGFKGVSNGYGVAYKGGKIYALSTGGAPAQLAVSSDNGNTWTVTTPLPSALTFVNINYDGPLLVAIADTESIYTSSDGGLTWNLRHSSPSTNTSSEVGMAYGNGRYVVQGASNVVLTSTDGITWTRNTYTSQYSPTSNNMKEIIYQSGYFYATNNATQIMRSLDGITWTSVQVPFSPPNVITIDRLAYGADKLVALGFSQPITSP